MSVFKNKFNKQFAEELEHIDEQLHLKDPEIRELYGFVGMAVPKDVEDVVSLKGKSRVRSDRQTKEKERYANKFAMLISSGDTVWLYLFEDHLALRTQRPMVHIRQKMKGCASETIFFFSFTNTKDIAAQRRRRRGSEINLEPNRKLLRDLAPSGDRETQSWESVGRRVPLGVCSFLWYRDV